MKSDIQFMQMALSIAATCEKIGEVPVGAIVTINDKIVSSACNFKETLTVSTAHAEILAIQRANTLLKNWRLSDATLYVTLEPCLMCTGAIYQSRIKRIVYATDDKKIGALRSLQKNYSNLNHYPEVSSGLFAQEAQNMLQNFFTKKRRT